MSAWSNFKDKASAAAGKWIDNWKDPQAADKSAAASAIGIIAPAGYPEHPGWRQEVRQNIENRKINREPSPFKDQLTNSLKGIKIPEPEINKDQEIER